MTDFVCRLHTTHDMVAMHGVINKYIDLSTSWESWVKEVEDQAMGSNWCRVEAPRGS